MRDPETNDADGVKPSNEARPLRFAGLVLDLGACALARESGEAIPLTRGEFALLRVFVARPGRVLSRDTLLDALANRRFGPFDRSVDMQVARLRRKIEPDPKEPRLIVTVPGEGYRFDGLMKTFQSRRELSIAIPASETDERRPEQEPERRAPSEHPGSAVAKPIGEAKPPEPHGRPRFALIGAGIVALILIAAGAWNFLAANRSATPRASIVVLPFVNLSADASQDYIVDALTGELTTTISRFPDSVVIARGTAFTYKGKAVDAKAIGRDLGVRYILEGSVQPVGAQVRVNVQLIDAESGAHLWADQFDTVRAELLQTQDEIVIRLARAAGLQLIAADAARLKRKPAGKSRGRGFGSPVRRGQNQVRRTLWQERRAGFPALRTGAGDRSQQSHRAACFVDQSIGRPPSMAAAPTPRATSSGARSSWIKL